MVDEENPLRPSHPPLYTTDKRISFRPITLERIDQTLPNSTQDQREGEGEEEVRPMFLKQPARYGPNAPEKLPGRKRDRDRAERRAAGMDVGGDEESGDEGMDTPLPHLKIGNTILQGQVTPLIGTEIILGLIRSTSVSPLLMCPLGPFLASPSLGPTLDYVEGNNEES